MNVRILTTRRCFALASASFMALSCSSANAAAAAVADQAQGSEVGEVVVTAQRREERLVDVPIAISHVSGKQLQAAGVTDFHSLQQVLPGVMISRTGAYAQPAIRGISSSTAGPGSSNNVAVYVDGIYHPFQATLFMDTEGVASIDVLKGPQGTLFGRNATGGAVLIATPEPTASPQGRIALRYGRFNDAMAFGQYSGPITDDLSFVVTAYARDSDNYLKDVGGFNTAPIRNYSATAKLRWKPTDKLTLELLYEGKENGDPTALTFNYLEYQAIRRLSPDVTISTTPYLTSLPRRTRYSDDFTMYAFKARYDTPIGYVSNALSYMFDHNHARYNAGGGTPQVLNETEYKQHSNAWQEELNLNSYPGRTVDYVFGLYFYKSEEAWKYADIISNAQSIAQPPGHFYTGGRPALHDKSFAAYGDITWNISDDLHLSGGLRYGHERVTVFNTRTGQDSETFESVTPRAVLRYDLDDHSNVYASFAKGFKAGTFNVGQPSTLIEPEHLTAYEVGYKVSRSIYSASAAAYYYDYKDLQVTGLVNGPLGAVLNITTNAAKAEVYGAEFQIALEPVERLNLSLSGSYLHARFDSYTTFSPALPNPATGYQVPATGLAGPQETDLSGQRLTRAPDWSFNAGGSYTWLLPKGSLTANANLSWQSRYAPTSPDWELSNVVGSDGLLQPSGRGQRLANPAYALVNSKVTWNVSDQTALSAYANNITGKKYFSTLTSTSGGVYGQWGAPREYGVRVDYSF